MTDLNAELKFHINAIKGSRSAAFKIEPPTSIQFNLNGPIGRIFEKDGQLHFEGDLHESAKVFFDYLCQNFWVDIVALRNEVTIAQKNERAAFRQLNSCRDFINQNSK